MTQIVPKPDCPATNLIHLGYTWIRLGRIAVDSNSKPADVDRLKEVLRLLKLAVDDCERLLAAADQQIRCSGQDNRPLNLK